MNKKKSHELIIIAIMMTIKIVIVLAIRRYV